MPNSQAYSAEEITQRLETAFEVEFTFHKGDDVDIDALVEAIADSRDGSEMSDQLFMHMYGHANWVVIDEVRKLPLKVADIYRRLTT